MEAFAIPRGEKKSGKKGSGIKLRENEGGNKFLLFFGKEPLKSLEFNRSESAELGWAEYCGKVPSPETLWAEIRDPFPLCAPQNFPEGFSSRGGGKEWPNILCWFPPAPQIPIPKNPAEFPQETLPDNKTPLPNPHPPAKFPRFQWNSNQKKGILRFLQAGKDPGLDFTLQKWNKTTLFRLLPSPFGAQLSKVKEKQGKADPGWIQHQNEAKTSGFFFCEAPKRTKKAPGKKRINKTNPKWLLLPWAEADGSGRARIFLHVHLDHVKIPKFSCFSLENSQSVPLTALIRGIDLGRDRRKN